MLFSASLSDLSPLPGFISFNSALNSFLISTSNPSFVGTYQIKVTGTLQSP